MKIASWMLRNTVSMVFGATIVRQEDSLIRIIALMFGWRKWVRRIGRGKYRFTKVAGHERIAHRLRTKGGDKIVMDGDG
jgi:hypothetical protein